MWTKDELRYRNPQKRRDYQLTRRGYMRRYMRERRKKPGYRKTEDRQRRERYLAKKEATVLAHGGKCCVCGYSKNLAVLVFHHPDGRNDDTTITYRMFRSWSLKRIIEALQETMLLCQNCHVETHHPGLER